jgi:hypothetical protein
MLLTRLAGALVVHALSIGAVGGIALVECAMVVLALSALAIGCPRTAESTTAFRPRVTRLAATGLALTLLARSTPLGRSVAVIVIRLVASASALPSTPTAAILPLIIPMIVLIAAVSGSSWTILVPSVVVARHGRASCKVDCSWGTLPRQFV